VRVVRGGSWDSEAKCCRAAFRSGVDPGLHVGLVGFRMCAMALEP
jgi:formylglycine-generating enzyme required for sulfatase activity